MKGVEDVVNIVLYMLTSLDAECVAASGVRLVRQEIKKFLGVDPVCPPAVADELSTRSLCP